MVDLRTFCFNQLVRPSGCAFGGPRKRRAAGHGGAASRAEGGITLPNVMEGVRILEVAEHTFVPAASAILADWGAEVIKVEHPERGDAMRGLASSGVMSMMGSRPRVARALQPRQEEHRYRCQHRKGCRVGIPTGGQLRRVPDKQAPGRQEAAAHRGRRHLGTEPEHHLRCGDRRGGTRTRGQPWRL